MTKLVIGNTTNEKMFIESYKYIDALKVGIAQGFVCETKNTAGCTEKQFSAILKFKNFANDFGVSIIGDGGVREPSDVVKAIGAGAKGVMAGKIFAACPESSAESIMIDGITKKIYAGMASRYVQEKWRGSVSNDCPEGKIAYLDIGESAENLIKRYSGALRSGISYSGATDIGSFQKNVSFIRFK
jgi:IMP dehydrogenase/GMP reductase